MTKEPVIISTDPGIDDAAAITISLFAKELDIKMIVATWGNVDLDNTLNNALMLETFLKKEVPIIKGANKPLVRQEISAAEVHGKTGMAGYDFPNANQALMNEGLAATLMHEAIDKSVQKVTLMAIGPLTDLALLFNQYPDDLKKINKIVLMGGSINRGNYGAFAEYNIAGDPEAAQIVFQSGIKIQVAPLEIGHMAQIFPQEMAEINKLGEVGHMIYSLLTNINEGTEGNGIEIYDATAAGILLKPELFTFKPAHVEIELNGKYTYGASVMDFTGYLNKKNNAEIAVGVDTKKFSDWFTQAIKNADYGRKNG